jgi:actin related protein 2/3 complex subunit 1A/1B
MASLPSPKPSPATPGMEIIPVRFLFPFSPGSFLIFSASEIAFCPNNNTVSIYKKNGNEWEIEDVLQEHDQIVTSISWSAKSDTLLTCSHDRNAYVWSLQDGQWKPTLVILRINRAATQVKWSPNGNLQLIFSFLEII